MPFSEKCWTWWSTFRVPNGQLLERQEKFISTQVVNFLIAKWSTFNLPKTPTTYAHDDPIVVAFINTRNDDETHNAEHRQ